MQKPPSPPGLASPTVEVFLKTVLRSGLLDRDSLQTHLRSMPREGRDDAEAVAEHLIKVGQLTRFQVAKLLRGTALGLVLGPFHVLAPIAKGGMGTVYLARDTRSTLLVALKILPPRRAREEERLLARFRREMEMCQRVSHPHLAWTYEVGVYKGVYYIAMEYIPGRSLSRLVQEDGPVPVPRLARLFAEVTLALDHAHNQGLIHRDLKPSNIIITPNDHAKVLDLGLALMEGEAAGEREVVGGQGYVVGTMDYIAPEQTDDPSKVDARCDLYALGCTMYLALTGRPPFPGGTSRDKILRHRSEEPAPITALNPAVPPEFAALVHRMMAKDPQQRPLSAAAIRHELLAWADKGQGLPLDRPEDAAYEQAVALLEAKEPSAEMIAETIPTADEPSPEKGALPEKEALPDEETSSARTPPPAPGPVPEAIPVGIPVTTRSRRPRPRALGMDTSVKPSISPTSPAWVSTLILVAVGLCLAGLIALLLWLFVFRK
jgi:serine/threonine protein kinase